MITISENFIIRQIEIVGASQEDKRFLQILEKGAKLVDGYNEIPLQFRRVDFQLPNNKLQP